MRYYLEQQLDGETSKVGGQLKKTKAEINKWCEDNIKACGLDYRVGYLIKFKGSPAIYTWKWIKDNSMVKFTR